MFRPEHPDGSRQIPKLVFFGSLGFHAVTVLFLARVCTHVHDRYLDAFGPSWSPTTKVVGHSVDFQNQENNVFNST